MNLMSAENAKLKNWIRKMRRENAQLKAEKDATMSCLQRMQGTKCSIGTQTDVSRLGFGSQRVSSSTSHPSHGLKEHDVDEMKKFNKLMIMHNNLMKRHEKEVQTNVQHIETISTLTLKISELERELNDARFAQQQLLLLQQHGACGMRSVSAAKHTRNDNSVMQPGAHKITAGSALVCQHREDLEKLKEQHSRLTKDYERLLQEMQQLSPSFFEEIEDLKFALHQSARLNKEYETVLRRMCLQFGLPYPHPETVLDHH